MTVRNLWGELPRPNEIRSPAVMLREQADVLSQATDSVLLGRVDSRTMRNSILALDLDVFAPALNGYTVTILTVESTMRLYPVRVIDRINEEHIECTNEEEFVSALGEILSSADVRSILGSLLTQSVSAG